MQILRKLAPPWPPFTCAQLSPLLLAPLAPLGVKIFLGGFWHLSQLKFEESTKNLDFKKTVPLVAPLLLAPLASATLNTPVTFSSSYIVLPKHTPCK